MGKLRNFLFESNEPELEVEPLINEYETSSVRNNVIESVNINTEAIDIETFITDIYAQNGLYSKEKSIFKVEELIDSLPKEMTTEKKKSSVIAILNSFGLTITEVSVDGETRIGVLNGVLQSLITNGNQNILDKQNKIEEHKKEIERLEQEIVEQTTEIETSEKIINSEIEKIDGLVKFIEEA